MSKRCPAQVCISMWRNQASLCVQGEQGSQQNSGMFGMPVSCLHGLWAATRGGRRHQACHPKKQSWLEKWQVALHRLFEKSEANNQLSQWLMSDNASYNHKCTRPNNPNWRCGINTRTKGHAGLHISRGPNYNRTKDNN